MIKSYFKTTWRNLKRSRVYSFVNIAGLSLGMAASIFILQYVNFELSYDTFNVSKNEIYRVVNDRFQEGRLVQHSTQTYSGVGRALKEDYPEVENYTRVATLSPRILITDNKKSTFDGMAVDESFFSMFTYPLKSGDKEHALNEPASIVLSENAALKIFGDSSNNYSSVLGKLIQIERNPVPYKVTAVCANIPANSHLQFDFLVPYFSLYTGGNKFWKQAEYSFTESYFFHYIQLKPGTNKKSFQQKLAEFSTRHFKGNTVSGSIEKFSLQPLLKAHLYSDFQSDIAKTGSATTVWGALISAILIIMIAWINYVNLATASAMQRAKEVGVRKSSGATKTQLIIQFFSESLIANIFSVCVALMLVELLQSRFNQLVNQELSLSNLFQYGIYGRSVVIAFALLCISGILVSGLYPAKMLSSFDPIIVLKGKFISSPSGIRLRKMLVVGQFAITIALLIGAIVVYQQLKYVSNKDLGMDLSQIVTINPPDLYDADSTFIFKERSFKEELRRLPQVINAANSGRVPGSDLHKSFDVYRSEVGSTNRVALNNMSVSEEFIELYGIKLLEGRNFVPTDYSFDLTQASNVLLNQSAVQALGFSSRKEAVGKTLMIFESRYTVIGVVKNFHQKSLHSPLEPVILMANYSPHNPISVKIKAGDVANTIAAIKKIYDRFFPGNVFTYQFMDETFSQQYNRDKLAGSVFAIFSGIAITIASLGLLGLSLLATTQRRKEISIRKVLGASTGRIIMLLTGDFLKLIVLAFVIATPLAALIMHRWLTNFAYRIDLDAKVFIAGGLLAVIVALVTISLQTAKAALANPAKNLRSE